MTDWVWQHPTWPEFIWQSDEIEQDLTQARYHQGKLLGMLLSLTDPEKQILTSDILADEIITSSAIEGLDLTRQSVRSSIAHRLGLNSAGISSSSDPYIEGFIDIMLNASQEYNQPLTFSRLNSWHAALFPSGYSHLKKITVAKIRQHSDMQIVSGRPGNVKIHYVAPPHQQLKNQVTTFINWFNKSQSNKKLDGLIRAAIIHMWFENLHPYDDGNGRIGRALIDLALSQDEENATRFYSMSSAIKKQHQSYYQALQKVSVFSKNKPLDITAWIKWFLACFIQAIKNSVNLLQVITAKSEFWKKHQEAILTKRQIKVLNKLLDKGIEGFEGNMTTRKYTAITKTSRATAYRELNDLVKKGCLITLESGGRSTAYAIRWR